MKALLERSLLVLACLGGSAVSAAAVNFAAIKWPIIFRGDATTAYRRPAALCHQGVFHPTHASLGLARSGDRLNWTWRGE